jgi:glyoxylase-like metal-dependent hydrolase (beta-lactamase superfamily II)
VDAADIARQLGLMPPRASAAERGLTTAANARARLLARLGADDPEQVADGVWLLRGGFPGKSMNAYLIADGDGVTLFDAAVSSMGRALAAGAARLGGLRRVVLGHGHVDHRGGAAHLRAPVLCHPDARADVEGDAGQHYMHMDRLAPFARPAFPFLMSVWDGGPLSVTDTVREGDDVAGFRVIDLPGHAPGQIGLWREADRVALCSDCFYTLDSQTGLRGAPRIPHAAFNHDTQQAHDSLRKLAALEPRAAWAGHADPVVGDVRAVLEHAADTT